ADARVARVGVGAPDPGLCLAARRTRHPVNRAGLAADLIALEGATGIDEERRAGDLWLGLHDARTLEAKTPRVRAPVVAGDAVALAAAIGRPAGLDHHRDLAAAIRHHAGVHGRGADRRAGSVDVGPRDVDRLVAAGRTGQLVRRARLALDVPPG